MTLSYAEPLPAPVPTLFPYQLKGAEWLSRQEGALLADEMGLGKSAQAILACRATGAKAGLVVCPAVVRVNWSREFDKFWFDHPPVTVIESGKDAVPEAGIVVCSYDALRSPKLYAELMKREYDVLILDEAHYLKTPSAKRTRKVYGHACDGKTGLASRAAHVWALTGTPAPNNATEIWTHLHALAPSRLRNPATGNTLSFTAFMHRYCVVVETVYGPKIVSGKNYDDLRARLDGFYLRREKSEVQKDLPPMVLTGVTVSADHLTPAVRKRLFGTERAEEVRRLAEAGMAIPDDPHIAELRREIGEAKVPGVCAFVSEFLAETKRKLVVFAHHRNVMDHIEAQFPGTCVRIDGSTPPAQRTRAVDSFQDPDGPRLFLGQIVAAGTGITLTAASDVLFAELSWTPADNAQAAARVHRIGQARDSVLIRFTMLADTIDEAVTESLRRKTAMVRQVFN
jgi:SWI/SNF-related matrix-associated actin-dependent regulator 1 of chromatin subfamily A